MADEQGRGKNEAAGKTATFEQVLREEWSAINEGRAKARKAEKNEAADEAAEKTDEPDAPPPNLTGLAFSGGGIRSATFNLGVIQALAELRLLRKFDYVSTVSGGGYIGSWLTAWMSHSNKSIDEIEEALAPIFPPASGSGKPKLAAGDDEPPPLKHLRSYTDYLKPHGGLFSLDAVTAFTTWLRNTLLNQIILLAAFALLLLIPIVIGFFAHRIWHLNTTFEEHWVLWLLGCVCLATAVGFINLNLLYTRSLGKPWPWYVKQLWVSVTVLGPLALGSLLLSFCLPSLTAAVDKAGGALPFISGGDWLGRGMLVGMPIACCVAAFLLSTSISKGREVPNLLTYVGGFLVATLLGLLVFLPALGKLFTMTPDWMSKDDVAVIANILPLGAPSLLAAFSLAVFVNVGFIGRDFDEHQREWWSRLIAMVFFAAVAWLALFGFSIWGPLIVNWLEYGVAAAVAWLITSGAGAMIGRSGATGKPGENRLLDLIARVIPYIFVPGLCLLVAFWLNESLLHLGQPIPAVASNGEAPAIADLYPHRLDELRNIFGQWPPIVICAVVSSIVAGVLTWLVDINLFSFHSFYRNRLTRAYLAAGVPPDERDMDKLPLTGMSDKDSPKLQNLESRPYHILNTALNITSGDHPSWQERKAASFFFSKKYCGYYLPGEPDDNYCPTGSYVKKKQSTAWLSQGLPMTISGAAASPNWGYHTSPALAFLMTVFNVRLGWWTQNTSKLKNWESPGPSWGLGYLIKELTANVDEDSEFVYLTDGGHFENLGIYELVRRRCQFILACDAGADPKFEFEDLGNAIRKCYVDLGVRIDIDVTNIRPEKKGQHKGRSKEQYAIGFIYYPQDQAHGQTGQAKSGFELGVLLYIKSSMAYTEATDIEQYKSEHVDFPHDPTANQFFTESQFESYRKLGYGLCRRALKHLEVTKAEFDQKPAEGIQFRTRDQNLTNIIGNTFGDMLKVIENPWANF